MTEQINPSARKIVDLDRQSIVLDVSIIQICLKYTFNDTGVNLQRVECNNIAWFTQLFILRKIKWFACEYSVNGTLVNFPRTIIHSLAPHIRPCIHLNYSIYVELASSSSS